MSIEYHKDLHLSQASNFILQSKTFTNISEPIYKLADLLEEVIHRGHWSQEELKLELLDLCKLIKLLREHHIKQLSKVSSVRMLNDLMHVNSPQFRKEMVEAAIKIQRNNASFKHPFDLEVENVSS